MPELELPALHLPEARAYLHAVMLRPRAPTAWHQRFVKAIERKALLNVARRQGWHRAPAALREAVGRAALEESLDDLMKDDGGLELLTGSPKYPRGNMAGRLLFFVLSCAEHTPGNATLEHAYTEIGSAFGNAHLRGGSRAYLAKCWHDFAPAAHLWIASEHQQDLWQAATGAKLAEFLGYAEFLRIKGEAVRIRNFGPFLDPNTTWRVPETFVLKKWYGALPTPLQLIESMRAWKGDVSK